MDFSKYIFRSSMVGGLISLPKPLTDLQSSMLKDYTERMSGIGRPLTENQIKVWHELNYKLQKSKEYTLTDGQKAILRELVRQKKYGYITYPNADEMEKGLIVEKESRDLMSEVLGVQLVKDDERRTNEWVTGKRDIKSNIIVDIKSAFSHSSFSKMLDDSYKENERYLRQADCYMELWDCTESIISHVLVDSPLDIIEKEIRKVIYRPRLFNGISKEFTQEGFEIIQGIVHDHIVTEEGFNNFCNSGFQMFGDVYVEFSKSDFPNWNETPKEERIHMIPHSFDPIRIEQRNECIKICREYMGKVKPVNNLIKL